MKKTTMSLAAALIAGSAAANLYAADDFKEKRTLKNNMMEVYNVLPESADNLTDAFANGVLYGRLRSNMFKWDWKNEDGNQDNKAWGIGGSLIYKTAPLYGFSGTAGLYYASSPFKGMRVADDTVGKVKSGKDTFSRYQVATSGDWQMAVLAQAYLQYSFSKTTFKAGRQIFESFLTKSNDTKMIPNTFMGYVVETKEIPDTRIRAAYFTHQKLRDHTTFHDVLTFNDGSGGEYGNWNNNDDSAVHKGLNYRNFQTAGEDVHHQLIVADVRNTSIKNLQLDLTYGAVPSVVSSLTGEVNYKIPVGGGFNLIPGVRYMYQMDDGGGEIGGASLKGNLAMDKWTAGDPTLGYDQADTLESDLLAARLVLKDKVSKFQIAYSQIGDKADIVAPWRGFPTGGYTRAMAQYNWYANTKTYDVEAFYDFGKAGLVPGFRAMIRYAIQDFDEIKQLAGNQADSNIIHIDMWEKIKAVPGLEAKLRIGLVSADERKYGSNAGKDVDSYNEYRFELNYLF